MKNLTTLLLAGGLLLMSQNVSAQRAKDGDYTATTAGEVLNSYTFLNVNAAAGATSISVDDNSLTGGMFGGSLAPGDLILIIQMYGASIDINTVPTVSWGGSYTVPNLWFTTGPFSYANNPWEFGQVTAYGGAGYFERVEVESVSGSNTINLQCALENSYVWTDNVQIVRIPRLNQTTLLH